jgi:hypothetical protein
MGNATQHPSQGLNNPQVGYWSGRRHKATLAIVVASFFTGIGRVRRFDLYNGFALLTWMRQQVASIDYWDNKLGHKN